MIDRKTLMIWSIIRDGLNWLLVGQIPGVCQLLDIPLLIMHYKYAGAKASFTLLELIPAAGFIPIFTIAAYCYPDPETTASPPLPIATVHTGAVHGTYAQRVPPLPPTSMVLGDGDIEVSMQIQAPKRAGVYAYVDGNLTPIRVSSEQMKRIITRVRAMHS